MEVIEDIDESSNSETEDSSSSASDGEDTNTTDGYEHFERDLPSRHQYLGDLQELRGRTVVDENEHITIPLLDSRYFANLVLLPNQILPLTVYNPREKAMIMRAISGNKIIGLVHTEITMQNESKQVAYGITAEIFQYNDEEHGAISVKARGMQRFRVQNIRREITGSYEATVRILPEIILFNPVNFLNCKKVPVHGEGTPSKSFNKFKVRCSHHTSVPHWVYDLYDTKCLAKRLKNDINELYNLKNNTMCNAIQIPESPIELSQWASINLPIQDSHRLELLSLNTANQRLRYLLSIIASEFKLKMLACNNCGERVSDMKDVFSLSAEGPQGTFVNPSGFVHEMFTVKKISGLKSFGSLTSAHSWFPGYSWLIVNCKRCRNHIGWKFVAKSGKLKPDKFYGISRKSVRVMHVESTENIVHCH